MSGRNVIDLPWGKLVPLANTEEFDVSTETIEPGHRMPPYYYKTGREIIYILEGEGQAPERKASAGDLFYIQPGQIFELVNTSDKLLRFLVICIPPYDEGDCVWLAEK